MGLLGILLGLGAADLARLSAAGACCCWRRLRRSLRRPLRRRAAAGALDADLHGQRGAFVAQFFPLFLLGALFGKLMEDSGSVTAIAQFMTERLGPRRAMLAVVLAGALVTYGGVSLFVAFFVLAPMAQALFRAADIPRRLMPAAIALGTSTFTMSALPGTPAIQNAIPMPFFGTTPFAAPGLGIIASAIMLGFGLWWLGRAEAVARAEPARAIGDGADAAPTTPPTISSCASARRPPHEFDPAEIHHGHHSDARRRSSLAVLPLVVVVAVNLLMSLVVLPRLDASFLAEERWGATSLSAVAGVWAVVVALAAAIVDARSLSTVGVCPRCARAWMPAPTPPCCRCSASPASSASAPSSRRCRPSRWCATGCLSIGGGPLVSLAVATNVLAALTGSASGGLTIALDALGGTYMRIAARARHRSGADAPRRGDRRGHAGQPAAQRRGGDAARGLRLNASRELSRHRHGRDRRRADRAGRGHCAGVGGGIVLRGS